VSTATIYRTVIATVPHEDLSANARVHHMARARRVKELREFTYWQTRQDAPSAPIAGRMGVSVTIGWPKGRKRQDATNVGHCLKAIVDGMTDAGWWVNDKQVTIREPIEQQSWGEWNKRCGAMYPHGWVVLDIEEVSNG
jgi:Holliday junction resolvase RusA-like endonuclease